MSTSENRLREDIVRLSQSLFERGFSVSSAGNISAMVDDGILMIPTNGFFPEPAERGRPPTGAAALMFASTPEKQQAAWKFMKFITDATGATIMVKGSGCMPPNSRPAEDPALLRAFYETHPNHMTALRQAPCMTAWYAFPGGEAFQFGDNFINDRITDLPQLETGSPPRSCQ